MIKLSNRLASLCSFIQENDSIVDIGCDHGYLSIYLAQNKLCKNIIASDINQNALNQAITNIAKYKVQVKTVLSDGIDNINLKDINCLIISGMGTGTILHILRNDQKLKKIDKIIIQSNNDHEILRKKMNEKGYYLENETATLEKEKWYLSMEFKKSLKKNTIQEIEFGLLKNKEYINYLLKHYQNIEMKIPFNNPQKEEYQVKINKLKNISE